MRFRKHDQQGRAAQSLGCALRLSIVALVFVRVADQPTAATGQVWISDSVADEVDPSSIVWETDERTAPAQFQQALTPQVEATGAVPTPAAAQSGGAFWTSFGAGGTPSFAAAGSVPSGADFVSGRVASIRASTDAGDLLGGAPMVLDLGVQRRNPIVNDPRVRGSQVGSMSASGSYWVPARIDLDTMVSKIDSRIVDHAIVIPGPYSALYGPGRQFIDFQLKKTPRTDGGFQAHGSTLVDYHTNGEQWNGRQSAWGGDDVWGFRVGYGHRTGNDYKDGNGTLIPGSFKSRDIDLALGAQLTPDGAFEGQALRLDQTDVELAGQAFDIDWLVTDGYEFQYVVDNPAWADRVELDAWYNRTRFEGSAQRASKRKQFPFFDTLDFRGFTDVDSMSTGYRLVSHWDGAEDERLDAGADLRFVKQDLNEITSARRGLVIWTNANSPIPKSDWLNPGLFVETAAPVSDVFSATAGARLDYVGTRVLESPAELQNLGIASQTGLGIPLSAADYWGSDDTQANDLVGLGFFSLDGQGEEGWSAGAKAGYSERAPNLTERYAVEPFMDLIQNGLNTVTGDPELKKERAMQVDLRIGRDTERFHGEFVAFHAWVHDYVTYEAMSVAVGPPDGQIEQVNLKFVNTDLATLFGWQARAEYQWSDMFAPFASLKYVQGVDRTRNGAFATRQAEDGMPSVRIDGAPRGSESGLIGGAEEPLPSILPLESRVGLRWQPNTSNPDWGAEISARIVDNQNRVAASLAETLTAGFTVWDLRAFYRPYDDVQLIAGVENFTDKQYLEHLDYRSANPIALFSFRQGVSFYFGTELQY